MKNFIFISPNFPDNYWKFCCELANNGLNVLGIGDCPYFELREELRNSLTEYYRVKTMTRSIARLLSLYISTVRLTFWRAITSIGWNTTPRSGRISIFFRDTV